MKEDTNKIFILLAEDDEDDRFLFTEAVGKAEAKIKLVTDKNGEELMVRLSELGTDLPDVIVLDINMPLKNGFDCLSELKANPNWKNIPVIIYSTSTYIEQIEKAYEKGAAFYFPKPDSFNKLVDAVKRIYTFSKQVDFIPNRENFLLNYQSE